MIATNFQSAYQVAERHLAGIGFQAEHALTKECPRNGNAVEPADELVIAPTLYRMRVADSVQSGVGDQDVIINPSFFATSFFTCAKSHHVGEGRVDPDVEPFLPHDFS